jgi:hypothetical protein
MAGDIKESLETTSGQGDVMQKLAGQGDFLANAEI